MQLLFELNGRDGARPHAYLVIKHILGYQDHRGPIIELE